MIKYISVSDAAKKWEMSERSARNYCAQGRVAGAVIEGKTWKIPFDAEKPKRLPKQMFQNNVRLIDCLTEEFHTSKKDGIYGFLQVNFAYFQNILLKNKISYDCIKNIFCSGTLGDYDTGTKLSTILFTNNLFKSVDFLIENNLLKISLEMINSLICILNCGIKDSAKNNLHSDELKNILQDYNSKTEISQNDILALEKSLNNLNIFEGSNKCISKLIVFKEFLKYDILTLENIKTSCFFLGIELNIQL